MALSPIYTRYLPNNDIRSMGISAFSGAFIAPSWNLSNAWIYPGSSGSITPTSLSSGSVSGFAFAAVVSDGGTGIWALPWSVYPAGNILHAVSGQPTSGYVLPSGHVFNGLAQLSGTPYFIEASGHVYTVSGAVVTQLAALGSGAVGLAADSSVSKLYTLNPVYNGNSHSWTISSLTIPGLASGLVAVPASGTPFISDWPAIKAFTAANGQIAIGGWLQNSIGQGFNAIAIQPPSSTAMVGLVASGLSLYTLDSKFNLTLSQTVSGQGTAAAIQWSPDGTQLFVSDPIGNKVTIYNFSLGTLTLSQTLNASGAAGVAILSTLTDGIIIQPSKNTIQPITKSVNWSNNGGTIAIGNPQCAVASTASQIIIGCVSGLVPTNLNLGIWSFGTASGIGFNPQFIAVDENALPVACSGSVVYRGGLINNFSGSAAGLSYKQGQTFVSDSINQAIKGFSFVSGAFTQQSTYALGLTPSAQSLVAGLMALTSTTSTKTIMLQPIAPFVLANVRVGHASIYNGGIWTTTKFGVGAIPTAMAYDPSGNVSVVTQDNNLYTVNASGLVASGAINQFAGQTQTTPEGFSSLLWLNGHLYATSMLNSSIAQIE